MPGKSIKYLDLHRIRQNKRRKNQFLRSLAPFCTNRPKFKIRLPQPCSAALLFIRPFFWVMRPINRPVGNTINLWIQLSVPGKTLRPGGKVLLNVCEHMPLQVCMYFLCNHLTQAWYSNFIPYVEFNFSDYPKSIGWKQAENMKCAVTIFLSGFAKRPKTALHGTVGIRHWSLGENSAAKVASTQNTNNLLNKYK